jgi:poly(hydroxyalkanoate) granule-associated protein
LVNKHTRLAEGASDNQLAATVRDSAQQIWLAGLGAFGKAQAEGAKVFEALVKEGRNLEGRTRKFAQMRMGSVTGTVEKAATKATARATATWDKLEQVFEDRVARALNKLGVPTNRDIQNLAKAAKRAKRVAKK